MIAKFVQFVEIYSRTGTKREGGARVAEEPAYGEDGSDPSNISRDRCTGTCAALRPVGAVWAAAH